MESSSRRLVDESKGSLRLLRISSEKTVPTECGDALGDIPGICRGFYHGAFIEVEAETGRDAEDL